MSGCLLQLQLHACLGFGHILHLHTDSMGHSYSKMLLSYPFDISPRASVLPNKETHSAVSQLLSETPLLAPRQRHAATQEDGLLSGSNQRHPPLQHFSTQVWQEYVRVSQTVPVNRLSVSTAPG